MVDMFSLLCKLVGKQEISMHDNKIELSPRVFAGNTSYVGVFVEGGGGGYI